MDFNKIAKIGTALIAPLLLAACESGSDEGVSTAGHASFIKVANQEIQYALSGTIEKKSGFNTNCSVDKDTDNGILITRGVCDNENSFTIRVTNTAGYPPSKRLKYIFVHYDNTEMKLYPKQTEKIVGSNGNSISIKLSRTASAFFIKGTLPPKKNKP